MFGLVVTVDVSIVVEVKKGAEEISIGEVVDAIVEFVEIFIGEVEVNNVVEFAEISIGEVDVDDVDELVEITIGEVEVKEVVVEFSKIVIGEVDKLLIVADDVEEGVIVIVVVDVDLLVESKWGVGVPSVTDVVIWIGEVVCGGVVEIDGDVVELDDDVDVQWIKSSSLLLVLVCSCKTNDKISSIMSFNCEFPSVLIFSITWEISSSNCWIERSDEYWEQSVFNIK